eukprot:177040-Hanusia_phi.AAC.4
MMKNLPVCEVDLPHLQGKDPTRLSKGLLVQSKLIKSAGTNRLDTDTKARIERSHSVEDLDHGMRNKTTALAST